MTSVAVTGATGFVGSHLAKSLAALGHTIYACSRSSMVPEAENIHFVEWKTTKPAANNVRVDAVIDCASAIPNLGSDDEYLFNTNVNLATKAISLAERTGALIIYISSQAAIGRPNVKVITGQTYCEPDTVYGRSKLVSEDQLERAICEGRVRGGIALRFPAIVGCGSHSNFPSNVVEKLRTGDTIRVVNPETLYNGVVHIDDVIAFISKLIFSPITELHRVSLASKDEISLIKAVSNIADVYGVEPLIQFCEAPYRAPLIDLTDSMSLGFEPSPTLAVLEKFTSQTIGLDLDQSGG
ncbi:MAG: hypothetical protein CMM55_13940 [Rhodospirillaceae bacterium]|nr:hypothetical protein [Rhodospirillaceae bacterium]|tara:strand:- start:317 stop:1207 length:891 start_codon:yes stop_codon:yes gene_type:complete